MITFRRKQSGFTIVELVVIIAVIGILAGITIVGFGAWRQRTAESEVKSDLNGVSSAMENARNFSTGYPTSIPESFKPTATVGLAYISGDKSNYCVEGYSKVVSSVMYRAKNVNGSLTIEPGTCIAGTGYQLIASMTGAGKTTCSSGSCTGVINEFAMPSTCAIASDSSYYYVGGVLTSSIVGTNKPTATDSITFTFNSSSGVALRVNQPVTGSTFNTTYNPASANSLSSSGYTTNPFSITFNGYNSNSSQGSSTSCPNIWFRIPKSSPSIITIPVVADVSNMPNSTLTPNKYLTSLTLKKN